MQGVLEWLVERNKRLLSTPPERRRKGAADPEGAGTKVRTGAEHHLGSVCESEFVTRQQSRLKNQYFGVRGEATEMLTLVIISPGFLKNMDHSFSFPT